MQQNDRVKIGNETEHVTRHSLEQMHDAKPFTQRELHIIEAVAKKYAFNYELCNLLCKKDPKFQLEIEENRNRPEIIKEIKRSEELLDLTAKLDNLTETRKREVKLRIISSILEKHAVKRVIKRLAEAGIVKSELENEIRLTRDAKKIRRQILEFVRQKMRQYQAN